MGVRFAEPWWLAMLVLIAPAAWMALRWFGSMSMVRRWSAAVLRAALVALIACMLAGMSSVRTNDRLAVVAVVDVSGSVRRFADGGMQSNGLRLDVLEAARRFLAAGQEGRGPDDLMGVVVFDGQSAAVATPTRAGVDQRSIDVTMSEGTDIERALRLARALVPPDASGRLVLISDGNQTSGDALEAARGMASASGAAGDVASVPVDVVPLEYVVRRETVVESVDAPGRAPAESTVTVRVTLNSTDGASGTLRLLAEGRPVDINGEEAGTGRRIQIGAGRHVEVVRVPLSVGRIHRFEAVFEADAVDSGLAGDTLVENNRGEAFTVSPGRGAVLLVDGVSSARPGGEGSLVARALRESGIDVDVVAPEGVPSDVLSLQAFDLVMLENVPAEALSEGVQRQLSAFVRDLGGGLMMIGGPDSFGAGGWKGSAIEPILPVKLDLPEQLVMPEAAIVLVLDSSGSMNRTIMGSTRTQMQVAREAAALAVKSLDEQDLVGVIAFSNSPDVVVPLGKNVNKQASMSRIMSISADGGTNMGPAMELAAEQLRGVDAKIKHVIVMSDGRSMGEDMLPDLAERMKRQGISVSAIAVGDEADEQTMRQIAERGRGGYFMVLNPMVLPRVFLKAVRVVRSPLIRETPFVPVVTASGSPLVEGLGAPPELGGLVLTQRRGEPTVVDAMLTPDGEPVLSHWRVELGQVGAFTSDAHDWASEWLDWPGYRRLWTQVARTLAKPVQSRGGELMSEIVGDELRVRFEATDSAGTPRDLLDVPVTVYGPSGQTTEMRLVQTGPGVYEGRAAARTSGNYIAVAKPGVAGGGAEARLPPALAGASVSSGPEFRVLSSNGALLRQIAEVTGGRVLDLERPGAMPLFDRGGVRPAEVSASLWRVLLVWTVVVLVLDVATRRVAWDRFVSREFGVELKKVAAEAIKERGSVAAKVAERLKVGGERRAALDLARRGGLDTPVMALGEDDAAELMRRERDRRKAARDAEVAALREQRQATGPASRESARPVTVKDVPPEAAPSDGGLLAAKRRARARFGGDDQPAAGA